MKKIERKYLAHYINVSVGSVAAQYELLGDELEEFTVEMSAQVEKKKNILGQNSISITGYEKTASVDTFYAKEGSALYNRLQTIVDSGLTLDDLKADVVDVKLWLKEEGETYQANKEEVYIEILSYGGDTSGYQIPFKLHYTGFKQKGTFDVTQKVFTPEAE